VLFQIYDVNEENIRATGTHICILDADGNSDRIWLKNTEAGYKVQWSPDGRRLAFSSAKDDNLFVLDIETRKTSRLTKLKGSSVQPEWSPDGSRLAFLWYEAGWTQWDEFGKGDTAVYVVNADGSDVRELVRVPEDEELDFHLQRPWSPDGKKLIFSRLVDKSNNKLYVADVDTGQVMPLTDYSEGFEADYTWSPDSQRIAFTSRSEGRSEDKVAYVVDADGRNLRRLLDVGDGYDPIYWSPDGAYLALLLGQIGPNPTVFIAAADGSRVTQLAVLNSMAPSGRSAFAWSPDGKRIAVFPRDEKDPLHILHLATGNARRVFPPTGFDWGLYWIWSPDGRWIMVTAESEAKSGEDGIFLVNPESGEAAPIITLPNWISKPVWMSDGNRLAFIAYHPDGRDVAQPIAYVVGLDGEVVRQIPVDCEWPVD
jgi:TolB protein